MNHYEQGSIASDHLYHFQIQENIVKPFMISPTIWVMDKTNNREFEGNKKEQCTVGKRGITFKFISLFDNLIHFSRSDLNFVNIWTNAGARNGRKSNFLQNAFHDQP